MIPYSGERIYVFESCGDSVGNKILFRLFWIINNERERTVNKSVRERSYYINPRGAVS